MDATSPQSAAPGFPMPRFIRTIESLQKDTGTTVAKTVLIGLSQGAIMALESTQTGESVAGRVVSIAGRLAHEPLQAPVSTTLHFIHGKSDPLIACRHAVAAADRLQRLGADVTSDLIEGLGHGINGEAAHRLVERLESHTPKGCSRTPARAASIGRPVPPCDRPAWGIVATE